MKIKILKRKSFILPAVVFFILALCWSNRFAFAKYWYMKDFFKKSPDKMIKASEKEMMEDREILGKYDLFIPSSGTKDAGPFLNKKIHWEIGPIHHLGDLVLPDFMNKELATDEWVTKKPLFKKMGLNFQWLKDIAQYDVWSLESESPVYPTGKKYRPFELPYPTYVDLITWQKLRYLHGKEKGDVHDALKEVRHLMRLLWTNDNLVASQTVVKMLKVENQFEEIITPKEMGQWNFIPVDHVMRAKRYFYSLPSGSDIRLSDEIFNKMTKTNVGICPALYEGMMFYLGMRDLLSAELAYGYQRMHETVKNSGCRKTVLHEMWEDPNWPTIESVDNVKVLGKTLKDVNSSQQKDMKAAIGYLLSTLNGPNYLFQYGKK